MRSPWGKINPLHILAKNGHHRSPVDLSQNGHSADEKTGQALPPPLPNKSKWSVKGSKRFLKSERTELPNGKDHKIFIRDEDLDLLGEVIMAGMVAPPGTSLQANMATVEVNAKLTTKALIWGLHCLRLEDIVAVSYSDGSRRFTVHSYAFVKARWLPNTCSQARRERRDLHFLAPNPEEVLQWVSTFAEQSCYINYLPHPLSSSKKKGSVVDAGSSPSPSIKCRSRPTVLVILNPRSGRGRARKVFSKAEAVLKLAGFRLTVVETTSARHAQTLASSVDLSTCPDGIICVGGDGIINEVLNGLLSRDNAQQAAEVPIGIIPAGSDNSLVWTVLGIRDPISAAVAIVKGGMIGMDVFAVEWTKTGATHLGLTVAYYGFMSDVLELSAKYQKRFGPLRYFVAGALRLLRLPHYKCEIQYLPVDICRDAVNGTSVHVESSALDSEGGAFDRNLDLEAGPRTVINGTLEAMFAAQTRMTIDNDVDATNEPSDYVRGLDAKAKRQPSGRTSCAAGTEEALAVHHPLPGATSPSPRPRTRSKSRSERSWSGLSVDSESARVSRANSVLSSNGEADMMTNASGPKWDSPVDNKLGFESDSLESNENGNGEVKWELRQGHFLGIMVCNHQCKTVQCLPSQALAPAAEHDDGTLDLMIVRAGGRLQLLRFFWLMQFNRHLKLPFVEYVKVRQVILKTGSNSHQGCGIDGELLMLNGPISTSLLPYQCRLIGRAKQRK